MEVICSVETSKHFATTRCRNPKECHDFINSHCEHLRTYVDNSEICNSSFEQGLYFANKFNAINPPKNLKLTSEPMNTAQRHPSRVSQKVSNCDSVVTYVNRESY